MSRGRPRKYPWDDWADGETHEIHLGDQYALSTFNMQVSLHGYARAHGIKVSTRSFTERYRNEQGEIEKLEGLIFQFWEPDK